MARESVHCECGGWSGENCGWSGLVSETVVVEVMPVHLRATHVAARNVGSYPANGAQRMRVARQCADRMIEHDQSWVAVCGRGV